ncbi:hypothetical protein [Candidatus Nitrospira bockiana]
MNTYDPDRCPAGHDHDRLGRHTVIQCQGSLHHDGPHYYREDHYVIRWEEPGSVAA